MSNVTAGFRVPAFVETPPPSEILIHTNGIFVRTGRKGERVGYDRWASEHPVITG